MNTNSETLHNRIRAENAAREAELWAAGVERTTQIIYVDVGGSDVDDDHLIELEEGGTVDIPKLPYKTIEKALSVVSQKIADYGSKKYAIQINTGVYQENNPLVVPAGVSIVGTDLRTVDVIANNPSKDLFHLNNGCYVYGIRPAGCEADDLSNPTEGAFFQFAENAFITTSPYVQNCTATYAPQSKAYAPLDYENGNPSIGNGPIGMLVDSERLNPYSPLKSMIVDAYTQVAFNGIGIVIRNKGYAQLVSFFTNFSHVGVWCINGGHASLLNSNTTFGDYGLRSSGYRELPNIDLTDFTPLTEHSNEIQDIINVKSAAISYMLEELTNWSGSVGSYPIGSDNYNSTIADAEILYDSIVQDMSVTKPSLIKRFILGLFTSNKNTGKLEPHFPKVLLPDFIFTYEKLQEYILANAGLSANAELKLIALFDVVITSLNELLGSSEPNSDYVKRFESLVTSTSHDFSYSGSGVNFLALPDHQGGNGETNYDLRVVRENEGRVAYTAGDEKGDFYIGDNLIIRNAEGDIVGRDFELSVQRLVVGLIDALGGAG